VSRIETLIGSMTLAEKLGQLTMTASTYAVTGPIIAGDSTEAIKAGTIGNLLNMVGAAHVRELQRLAVKDRASAFRCSSGSTWCMGTAFSSPCPWGRPHCSIRKPGSAPRASPPRRLRPKASR